LKTYKIYVTRFMLALVFHSKPCAIISVNSLYKFLSVHRQKH